MSHGKKVPPPYTATAANPGGNPQADGSVTGSQNFVKWVQADVRFKESSPQVDYSSGSGEGINNG